MPKFYTLDAAGNPRSVPTLIEWAKEFEEKDRRVAYTKIGDAEVSTVFLGLDHGFGHGPPLLFESMIFWEGHGLNADQERYTTREEALAGHEAMVTRVRSAQILDGWAVVLADKLLRHLGLGIPARHRIISKVVRRACPPDPVRFPWNCR